MLSGAYPQYRVRYYRGEYDKNRTLYRTQAEALEKGGQIAGAGGAGWPGRVQVAVIHC